MIEVMLQMDKSILELALVDAFSDMCLCEGDEFIKKLENYIETVKAGKNTEEQDVEFFTIAEFYIEKSINIYNSDLFEGQEEITVGADTVAKSNVPVDALKQMKDKSRKIASKELTEEEINNIGAIIFETLKGSLNLIKDKVSKSGTSLANATTSGIVAAGKKLQSLLVADKNTGKEIALAEPDKKK